MRFVAVQASIHKQQRKYNNMMARMQKYIDVPAECMRTEQMIEDYENWGYEVLVKGSRYFVRRNMIVMSRAGSEQEFRDQYATFFSSMKL